MNSILRLQQWYASQCDGRWEHRYGVRIDTLDNPGWKLAVDLAETPLAKADFISCGYGVKGGASTASDDWLQCYVEDGKFCAAGGPSKLDEMISVFLHWADENSPSTYSS